MSVVVVLGAPRGVRGRGGGVRRAHRAATRARGQLGGEAHRLHHAAVVGDALAGDVERGAVVDRGADDRQARASRSRPMPNASSFTGISPWS